MDKRQSPTQRLSHWSEGSVQGRRRHPVVCFFLTIFGSKAVFGRQDICPNFNDRVQLTTDGEKMRKNP